ncbi:MAG: biliverdin-producing heme oxygenase [Sphingomonas bacterium]|nr:biliverdin-producing heme oxygenase [Sphingomonas bacterium]
MHAFLRLNTREWHDRVDAAFEQFDLTTERGYRSFLEAHAQVIPLCELHLANSGAERRFPGWLGTMRMPALMADLDAMGGTWQTPPDIAGNEKRFDTAGPALVGMIYVLEGSRLGGRILAKRVERGGNARCRSATEYLRHDGGVSWRSFLDRLHTLELSELETEAALAASIKIFRLFERAVADVAASGGITNDNRNDRALDIA